MHDKGLVPYMKNSNLNNKLINGQKIRIDTSPKEVIHMANKYEKMLTTCH